MTQLCAQGIRELCEPAMGGTPLIAPFEPEKKLLNGKSYGLSAASYDLRIAQDLSLEPGDFALASTVECLAIPDNLGGRLADKSTYARMGLSCFNTFFDPGFRGHATLELVNLSGKVIIIRAGDPICQIIFTLLNAPTSRPYRGKYNNQPARPIGPILGAG